MKEFLFLTHENTDPYFNIASEEYLLKSRKEFFVYLWKNSPSVILGVNQNAFKEVNLKYTESHGIKIVRRLTGGGAVYHDLNNLCYTFIAPFNSGEESYKKFTAPIIEYLNSLGVKAEFSGRNDITVGGRKISGNAQTVFGKRIMCHGTILIDTDESAMENALTPNKLKIESKGINSARKRVANVKDFLPDITADRIKDGLKELFLKTCNPYEFTKEDIAAINALAKEKYSSFEWNMGRSPIGEMLFEKRFSFGTVSFYFSVKNGRIENPEIKGDFFTLKDISGLEKSLCGVEFKKESVNLAISDIREYIAGATAESFVSEIFA